MCEVFFGRIRDLQNRKEHKWKTSITTVERKETILKSSKEGEDNCFKVLDDLEEHHHKDCYIVYTSKQK